MDYALFVGFVLEGRHDVFVVILSRIWYNHTVKVSKYTFTNGHP
jgi:hypothetical protein